MSIDKIRKATPQITLDREYVYDSWSKVVPDSLFVNLKHLVALRRRAAASQVIFFVLASLFISVPLIILGLIGMLTGEIAGGIFSFMLGIISFYLIKRVSKSFRFGGKLARIIVRIFGLMVLICVIVGLFLPENDLSIWEKSLGLFLYGGLIFYLWKNSLKKTRALALIADLTHWGIPDFPILGRPLRTQKLQQIVPKRHSLRVSWKVVFSYFLVFLVFLLFVTQLLLRSAGYNFIIIILLIGVWLNRSAARKLRTAQKMTAIDAEEALKLDKRDPVLFLRSFKDDSAVKIIPRYADKRNFVELINRNIAFDESIVAQLEQTGPVVAVGKPGEELPPLGALRMYLADDAWQARVLQLMQDSRLIVLLLGETLGLQWEISQIFKLGYAHKSIFYMPPVPLAEKQKRWQILHNYFTAHLDLSMPLHIPAHLLAFIPNFAHRVILIENEREDERAFEVATELAVAVIEKG